MTGQYEYGMRTPPGACKTPKGLATLANIVQLLPIPGLGSMGQAIHAGVQGGMVSAPGGGGNGQTRGEGWVNTSGAAVGTDQWYRLDALPGKYPRPRGSPDPKNTYVYFVWGTPPADGSCYNSYSPGNKSTTEDLGGGNGGQFSPMN